MNTLVIYDSKFGNTERIAQAIARGLASFGDVRVVNTGDRAALVNALAAAPDLALLGGPTQRHGASAALKSFFNDLPPALRGTAAGAFDTRYRGSTWLMGSAAGEAGKALARAGCELVAPPESFFIERRGRLELQQLEPGELDRAEGWGRALGKAVAGSRAA
jgi:flavodoxin